MKENVLLIYPPIDEGYYVAGVNDSPPLGLITLQNYVQRKLKLSVTIDVIDGEYISLDEILTIIKKKKYDLIGIQPMMASYNNTLKILKESKKCGSMTVVGGHHVTNLAEQIMKNRKSLIDYIILGDGEEAFAALILEKNICNIPNLMYYDLNMDKVVKTYLKNVPLEFGKIDYIDKKVLQQYVKSNKNLERGEALSSFRLYSHKGCSNRLNSQYCYFCGRADRGVRFKKPEDYIDELKYFSSQPNVKYIFEIGDDFLQDRDWLDRVAQLKETNIKNDEVCLKIFARANRITPEVVKILKRLKVDEVAIGFESGSEKILKNINKNATPNENMKAAELLFANGIDTIASFVFGLPGEDEKSIRETCHQAEKIRELAFKYLKRPPQEIIANLIEINPGSPAFKRLQMYLPEKYTVGDKFSIKETQDDYFKMVFGLKDDNEIDTFRNKLAFWGKQINNLGSYTYPAGWTEGEL